MSSDREADKVFRLASKKILGKHGWTPDPNHSGHFIIRIPFNNLGNGVAVGIKTIFEEQGIDPIVVTEGQDTAITLGFSVHGEDLFRVRAALQAEIER